MPRKKRQEANLANPSSNPVTDWLVSLGLLKSGPKVSIIKLSGVIGSSALMKSGLSLASLEEHITKAFSVPNLSCVALALNSPGGSPAQSQLIYNHIRRYAEEKNVPVVAFAEDTAASGGYWLACAADEIYALETSIVGSLGVISSMLGFHKAIEKIGVERRVYTEGTNKSILDPFMPEKEEDVALIKEIQHSIYGAFKDLVKTRRKDKLTLKDAELFTGRFWTGSQALDHGLVDGIGDLYGVMKERYGDKVQFIQVCKERGFLKRALQKLPLGASLGQDVLSAIEERSTWNRVGL